MVKRNSKVRRNPVQKCVSTGQPREDRAPRAATSFPPLSLEVRYPDTAILLLSSPEKPVLLAAAAALARYGEQARPNLEMLFDLEVTDSVLGLIEHEDVFTRRFALKLLALMSAVPNVRTYLLKTDSLIPFFTEMLVSESDVFLQEFASRILAELSSDPFGSAMLLDKFTDVSFLFEKLRSEDPDVKKNCIEIVVNLLSDFIGFNDVIQSKGFSFGLVYELFRQPYPIMQQLALDAIERLVMHNADECLQENFRQSGGVRNLLDILDQAEWNDLHGKVLHILNLSSDNQKTTELMNNTDGTKLLFNFMENTDNDKLKYEVLNILVRLAEDINGKKVLHSRGLVKIMFKHFEAKVEPDIQAILCQGIAIMSQYSPAADAISQENPINYILNLLNNKQAEWSERQAAAFALKELFSSDYQNCINFLDSNGQVHLMHLIEQPAAADVPWETQVTAVQAISAIANYSSLAYDLIDYDLFSALCSPLQPVSRASPSELKISCCEALSRFATIGLARRVLIQASLPQKLCPLLTHAEQPVPVREALTHLVLLLCAEPIFARLCVQQGLLVCMLKNRRAASSRASPTWAACVEALFNADLPMKFAYAGRLGLRDITDDGFYAMRRSSCPFPVLEELLRLKLCPLEPIYVANFGESPSPGHDDDYLASKRAAFEAARAAMRRESQKRGLRVSDGTINAWLELKFGRLQSDPELRDYLRLFKVEMAADEGRSDGNCSTTTVNSNLIQVSRISSRARLLGQFVARQLSGTGSGDSCVEQQLELHLRAIKESIETSVIPLGQLRVGSYLERALLFKVMADRIGLPACLVRGRYGRSWIEIAAPLLLKSPDDVSRKNVALPAKYLRENYIVDLMDVPGELVPIDSVLAKRYCEQRPCCEFTCCG